LQAYVVRVIPGRERRVAEDLEDAVYPLDPSVRTVPGLHGLVLLITSLPKGGVESLIKHVHMEKFVRSLEKYDLIIKDVSPSKALATVKKFVAQEKARVRILGNNIDSFIGLFEKEGFTRGGKEASVEIHIYGSIAGFIIRRTPVEH